MYLTASIEAVACKAMSVAVDTENLDSIQPMNYSRNPATWVVDIDRSMVATYWHFCC